MKNNKRILLVQLFSNGDCLYATTIARQIKKDFPGAHLTWAIAGFCKSIINENPYVDAVREVNEVPKSDVAAFRRFKKKIFAEKEEGKWDEVFVTQNMDDNQALYDGTVRGMILRAYQRPVDVPLQPVLVLDENEKQKVKQFAEDNKLSSFKNVILWEYAPQSGQSVLSFDFVWSLSQKLSGAADTCIILSSAQPFKGTDRIIDGSSLSVRENAELTHYCNLLIGCSSGLTWISTSCAAKHLPMVQLLDPQAYFRNAPSEDFKRYNIASPGLIEMIHLEENRVYNCIQTIVTENFETAKAKFNDELPVQFNTTRKIVYNLLCYLQFRAIAKHYEIMTGVYGKHPELLKQFRMAIVSFPFKLILNIWRKRIAHFFD